MPVAGVVRSIQAKGKVGSIDWFFFLVRIIGYVYAVLILILLIVLYRDRSSELPMRINQVHNERQYTIGIYSSNQISIGSSEFSYFNQLLFELNIFEKQVFDW